MNSFLATIKAVGKGGLFIIEPLSTLDPGHGGGLPDQGLPAPVPPVDPGWGIEAPVDPGYGHPGGGRPPHPAHPLPVPPPEGVVTPPIYLPDRPNMMEGAGVVVPLPAGATVPTPKTPPPAGTVPYVLWFGPGTASSVVYLPPSTPAGTPK